MEQKGAQFSGRHFLNPVPTGVMSPGALPAILKMYFQPHPGRTPKAALGPFSVDKSALHKARYGEAYITWLGHSTVLMAIDGKRLLIDPVWCKRVSPVAQVGPKRFFEVPVSLNELPPLDCILLSHDHYDHLDKQAIHYLTSKNIPVVTMLGVGKRLRNWGVRSELITEMDWWQKKNLGDGFELTALPARHFSGRSLVDRFTTLWGSFAIKSPNYSIYCGADSGYYEGFKKIGDALGPFDLTMLEIGAYNAHWADIHMGPEGAVQAHLDLRGKLLLPLHWATFALAFHPWKEPVERVLKAAAAHDVKLLLPAPGQTRAVNEGSFINNWWEK